MKEEVIIVNELLKNKKEYKKLYKSLNRYVKDTIGEPGCFDRLIYYKFNKKDLYIRSMKVNHFMTHLILWQPFNVLKTKVDASYIINTNVTNNILASYYNEKIIDPFTGIYPMPVINEEIAKIQEKFKKITEDYSTIFAISTSLYDVYKLMKESQEFRDFMNYEPPVGQPKDVEDDYNKKGKKLIKFLKKSNSPFAALLNAEEGIKDKQFRQYMLCIGFQSNMEGVTYPKPIQSSFLNKGLQTASEYLLDATTGRKAQIYNKVYTGNSGYFSRRLTHSATDTNLNPDADHKCNTKHLIEYEVSSPGHLKIINKMYYKTKRNSFTAKVINYKKDSHLVGQTIYLYSPLTCSDELVCQRCYGKMSEINNDINIGIYGAEEISAKILQGILSSKHLLVTDSSILELEGEYEDFITINGNAIIFDPSEEYLNKKKYYLVYNDDDIIVTDEDDDLDEKEFTKLVKRFFIKDKEGNIITEIYDKNDADFYISADIEKMAKHIVIESDYSDEEIVEHWVQFSDIQPDSSLFFVEIQNKELTKPLKDLVSILDTKEHLGCSDINSLVKKISNLFIESGITDGSILLHMMTAIRDIIRDVDNILYRPDFSKQDISYEIMTLKRALYNDSSLLISLTFEQLAKLLKNPLTYTKVGKSKIDPLFFEKFDLTGGYKNEDIEEAL